MKKTKYAPKEIILDGDISTYIVTPDGRVFNTSSGRDLVQWRDSAGYATVLLFNKGKKYRVKIHRLVYEVFKGKLKKGFVINHKDCNKLNNNVTNLEQIPYSKNTKHWYDNKELCDKYNKQMGEMPGYKIISENIEINR